MKVNNSKLIYKTITAYKEQNKKFGFSPKGVFWQNDKTQIVMLVQNQILHSTSKGTNQHLPNKQVQTYHHYHLCNPNLLS